MKSLVLKKFSVNTEDEHFVDIEARNSGLVAWVMAKMGVDNTFSLRCNNEKIEYTSASLAGKSSMTIPMTAITCVSAGLVKPWKNLVIGAALGLGGVYLAVSEGSWWMFFGGLILGAIFVALYILNKTMSIYVMNGGETPYGLSFKPSIIEGVEINSELVYQAIAEINKSVLKSTSPINSLAQQRPSEAELELV